MARQRMDDLYVEMIGDNKKYVRMLRNSVTETKKAVRQINAELAKIKDPGAGLSSYGGGIGGGRMPRGRGKGKLPKGVGKGALGISARGLGAQGLRSGGMGLAVPGVGGAAEVWEIANALKAMGLINPATITAAVAALTGYLIWEFNPAAKEGKKVTEELKASLEGLESRLGKQYRDLSFENSFLADGDLTKTIEGLNSQLHNAEFGLENAADRAQDLRAEIERLEGFWSAEGWMNFAMNNQNNENNKIFLEEANRLTKVYGDQVEEVAHKLRTANREQEKLNARLDAMPTNFMDDLTKQIDRAYTRETMSLAGASEQEIQRVLKLRDLEEEMAKHGRQLTEEQRKMIQGDWAALEAIEERVEARKEEQRISAENAKLVARQREEEEKARLRFNEDIAQRSFRLLQGDRSPMQVLKDDIKEIRYLIDQGGLTRAEGRSLINNRIKSMAESFGTSDRSAGAAIRGDSVEGYSLTKFGQHQRTSAEDLRSMLKELVNQGRTLDDIREGVTSHGPPIEPPKKATI